MRAMGLLIAVLALVGGCTVADENPKFDPQAEMPSWAYDAPFYYRPSEDLPEAETVGDGIGVYYTNEDSFFIPHPGGCQLNGVPRVGVWFSTDQGANWAKAGYYGVEQTHFNFLAAKDGDYWIRFVGPGQSPSECPPGIPHRIYVVDRQAPTIVLSVTPPPWEDEKRTIPRLYSVGENVTLFWGVSDAHLDPNTIQLGICFADFPHNVVWSRLPAALSDSDSLTIEIPPEARRDGGLRFRMEARDKSGNIGVAMSNVLHVAGPVGGEAFAPAKPGRTFERPEHVALEDRPGWPIGGQILAGRSEQTLAWLPPAAGENGNLELQFSPDDGSSWQTVATGLISGQDVMWTVPPIASDVCRLRVVAKTATPAGGTSEATLAISEPFKVIAATSATAPAGP